MTILLMFIVTSEGSESQVGQYTGSNNILHSHKRIHAAIIIKKMQLDVDMSPPAYIISLTLKFTYMTFHHQKCLLSMKLF